MGLTTESHKKCNILQPKFERINNHQINHQCAGLKDSRRINSNTFLDGADDSLHRTMSHAPLRQSEISTFELVKS